jgi:glycosyltransferase involved in cell wall biosynthesis
MKKRKYRVLVVGHTYVVGLNQAKLEEIARRGRVNLGLVVPKRWYSRDFGTTYELERVSPNIEYYPLAARINSRPGGYFLSLRALERTLRNFRPDLVHVEQEAFSLAAFETAVVCSARGAPFSLFCWQNVPRRVGLLRRCTRRYVARRASALVAGNSGAAKLVMGWGYRGPVEIMPQLGVDTSLFFPRRKPQEPTFRVGFVGVLSYRKGVDVLLEAGALLRNEGRAILVAVVGSGPWEKALRIQAERSGMNSFIEWRGWVPHSRVPEEVARMDALVLPTRTIPGDAEQLGHVLLEAMAMGVPVVGSSCGEIPNVIGRPDLIFGENDPDGLSRILRRLMDDGQWRREVIDYGLARVQQCFSNSVIAERLESVWIRVLSPENRRQMPVALAQ